MHPAERGRGGKNHDVAGPQAIHGLLIPVEPDELPVSRRVHCVGALFLEVLVALLKSFGEHIRQRHEFDVPVLDGQRVSHSPRAAPAAANESESQRAVSAWMYSRRVVRCLCRGVAGKDGHDGRGGRREFASVFQEFPT